MSLSIPHFFSIATRLSFQACRIMHQVQKRGDLGKIMKGEDDPVTEADFRIQSLIIDTLKRQWPTLRIVGEEVEKGQIRDKLPASAAHAFENIFVSEYKNKLSELPIKDLCVWIDPLDGTLSYTRGILNEVTSLIGMSFKQHAFLGVIGVPYICNPASESGYEFRPRVLAGEAFGRRVYNIRPTGECRLVHTPRPNQLETEGFRLVTSRYDNEQQTAVLKKATKNISGACGCGHKIRMVVEDNMDAMAYLNPGTSKWDTCAGEALLKAQGGKITSIYNEDIIYDPDVSSYHNFHGLVCTVDDGVHKTLVNSTKNFNKLIKETDESSQCK